MTNLKRIRESAGLSQSQLAKAAGVPLSTLQKYEQGYKDINGAAALTVYRLALALTNHGSRLVGVDDLLEFDTRVTHKTG